MGLGDIPYSLIRHEQRYFLKKCKYCRTVLYIEQIRFWATPCLKSHP